ncbi:RIP metalloprotease RseP [Massilia sp. PAMC28688]|uniref:RIP metalloprotease RseP n=1 Tax=Massilia sp. PAMC28688 TaxID=2861283 RepID=UPI001C626BD7|nr:RIP metalloprotease RseP [Massilia sp. PAMC28688]QYF92898.1 RIP metalloprotease RseP [Massilia sp. PAMC28688]
MSLLQTVLAFLLALGPLIVFHELGHYFVARLCGVKVLRFSVGMGKVVWSRKFGPDQTEWAISALPLGGYVKMLDDRDPATAAKTASDAAREFTRQSVWRRIAIVAAGPIANFLLAIVVLTGLYMYGMQDATTRLRAMPETAIAHQAGLREGDRIIAVNGREIAGWSELRLEIMSAAIDKTSARLEVVQADGGRSSAEIAATAFEKVDLEKDVLAPLGLQPRLSPAQLRTPLPGSAAEQAGLREGDVVQAIDGQPVVDGLDLIQQVRASKGRTVTLAILRDGAPLKVSATPRMDARSGYAMLGVQTSSRPEMVRLPAGPVEALAKGTAATWASAVMQVKLIGKIIMGELSWKNITGPVTIAEYAGESARQGPETFLRFLAAVSISLGVMNLLPIPVLDGGLLLYYSLEVLARRPLPERVIELAQRAGVVMLVMLMSLAFFNDAMRHI